jgi:D-glycero-D-manno-heptose 1,7-bisphosphate phosphatase
LNLVMRACSKSITAMPRELRFDFSNIRFVFLDRDGVLNRRPPSGQYITRVENFEVLPGIAEAIAALNRSGRKVIVVTNQRGVALGLYSLDDLDRMHEKLREELAQYGAHVDAIYVCPHDAGQCTCRKPQTGLIEQAFVDFPAARSDNSLIAGDSLRDIEAGLRAGLTTVFVQADEARTPDDQKAAGLAHLSIASLPELVKHYLCPPRP